MNKTNSSELSKVFCKSKVYTFGGVLGFIGLVSFLIWSKDFPEVTLSSVYNTISWYLMNVWVEKGFDYIGMYITFYGIIISFSNKDNESTLSRIRLKNTWKYLLTNICLFMMMLFGIHYFRIGVLVPYYNLDTRVSDITLDILKVFIGDGVITAGFLAYILLSITMYYFVSAVTIIYTTMVMDDKHL